MRPLLPPCSLTSKPPMHKSQLPGGPGDKILCDDLLIYLGLTSWSLLHVPLKVSRILLWFLLFLENVCTLGLYIVFLCQTENVLGIATQ